MVWPTLELLKITIRDLVPEEPHDAVTATVEYVGKHLLDNLKEVKELTPFPRAYEMATFLDIRLKDMQFLHDKKEIEKAKNVFNNRAYHALLKLDGTTTFRTCSLFLLLL